MNEEEFVVRDLLKKKTYKENIGKFVAVVGKYYVMADSGKQAIDEIAKSHPDAEPFVFRIFDPSVTRIPG